ncbi:serine/arginine repetitive matrix protein 3-like [Oryctolagus cuniculus]|uniref:serine/arginine repetitive matrix protein 3-like n=1 Tax=Oryctolagus cuniculus TaxID=9986 RepID=UPI00387A7F7F
MARGEALRPDPQTRQGAGGRGGGCARPPEFGQATPPGRELCAGGRGRKRMPPLAPPTSPAPREPSPLSAEPDWRSARSPGPAPRSRSSARSGRGGARARALRPRPLLPPLRRVQFVSSRRGPAGGCEPRPEVAGCRPRARRRIKAKSMNWGGRQTRL